MRTLQNVQADTTQLVDVGVEDLGEEADFGRDHRIVIWEEELELEVTSYSTRPRLVGWMVIHDWHEDKHRTFVWRRTGTVDGDVKIAEVLRVGDGVDTGHSGGGSACTVNPSTLLSLEKSGSIRLGHQTLCLLEDSLGQTTCSHG